MLLHHHSKGYQNPHHHRKKHSLFEVLLWSLGYYDDSKEIQHPPHGFEYPNPRKTANLNEPRLTWINHSTFLIQIDGISILTDPIWNERCAPVSFIGPKRLHPSPFALEQLPRIDYVLISHNHYDHLDKSSVLYLHALYPAICWLVPMGVGAWFRRHGIQRIVELDWWQSFESEKGLQFHAVPAQHFSGRGLRDRNRSLWMGWVVKVKRPDTFFKQLYFVGDTGYNDHDFKEIGERLGPMDLSLIPIGAYRPRAFMSPVHVNPNEAVTIHQQVRSQLSVASHWKTFNLSSEGMQQPPYDLYLAMQAAQLPFETFRALDPGQTINW